MKNTKITRKIAAALAAVMAAATMASIGASAATPDTVNSAAVNSVSCSFTYRKELREMREAQLARLRNTKKTATIRNAAFFHAKNVKFYGRKAVGVDEDGNFILGDWVQINKQTTVQGGSIESLDITFSGDYVSFAFSFDITWGTDFPYSGVFWDKDNIYNTDWEDMDIFLNGICRAASVKITVGDEVAVFEKNCSAHKEWRP